MLLRERGGGNVTQGTSKSTAVTIDNACGTITTHNAALAASTSVGFTVNCAYVKATDTVNLVIASGATAASYLYTVDAVTNGTFVVHLRNISGGSLGEAIVFNYTIIRNQF